MMNEAMIANLTVGAVFTVCVVFALRNMWLIAKHNRALFPFFELQRDIMNFLLVNAREKPGAFNKERYVFTRDLLRMVDFTVDNYHAHKTLIFNARKMAKHLEEYQRAAVPAVNVPDAPEIQAFHSRFRRLLVRAFFAYTPLIRSEILVRIFIRAYRAGADAAARRAAAELADNANKVRRDARRYGLIPSGATAA